MITQTIDTEMTPVSKIEPKRGNVVTIQDQNDFVDSFETTTDQFSDNVEPEINDISDEINIVITQMNSTAQDVNDDAISAAQSALEANSTANNQGAWSGLSGALNKGLSVTHTGSTWILNVDLADVTLSEPTAGNSDWTEVSGVTQQELDLKADKSDTYTKLESDNKFIDNTTNQTIGGSKTFTSTTTFQDLLINGSLNIGQIMQEVTGSRSLDVTYTNNTGNLIFLMLSIQLSTPGIGLSITLDSEVLNMGQLNSSAGVIGLVIPILNGGTYKLSSGTGIAIAKWLEIR